MNSTYGEIWVTKHIVHSHHIHKQMLLINHVQIYCPDLNKLSIFVSGVAVLNWLLYFKNFKSSLELQLCTLEQKVSFMGLYVAKHTTFDVDQL